MVTHMKTTIEIASGLLLEAKSVAVSRKTTLRSLVEEGLRRLLDDICASAQDDVTLRDCSYGNADGERFSFSDWAKTRAEIYGDRE